MSKVPSADRELAARIRILFDRLADLPPDDRRRSTFEAELARLRAEVLLRRRPPLPASGIVGGDRTDYSASWLDARTADADDGPPPAQAPARQ